MKARSSSTLFVVLLAVCSLAACQAPRKDADPRVKELLELQRKSRNGYITLDSETFDHFVNGKGRPYSLFLIGDARQLRSASKLNLPDRIRAFDAVARAFRGTHAGQPTEGKVFFIRLVYEDARDGFSRLGVKGLPYIARIPPSLNVRPGSSIDVPQEELGNSLGPGDWSVADIGSFVAGACGLSVGDLSAAGAASRSRFLPLLTLGFFGLVGVVGYKLYHAPIMRQLSLYAAGSLAVFWFSVSGGMYNIIRGVPLIGYNHRTRSSVLFLDGSGQMGAEGFIMGTLFMTLGLLAASFTRVLPTVKDDHTRRMAGYGILGIALVLYNSVLSTHAWKTHMRSSFYF